ncbi:MAG: alpha/beta hydrolase [Stellaceae bacterium]
MHKILWAASAIVVLIVAAFAGVLAFDAPMKPPTLASIQDPFAAVDFRDLPHVQTYAARDGARLGYRAYEGGGDQIVVMIHGSSDDGSGMHALAKAMRDAGASVYVPVLRGHYGSPRQGDIDYIGQLDDDLVDMVALLRASHPKAGLSLIGFSSGGGFVIRVIGGGGEKLFDRFILLSPALPPGAPTHRPNYGDWAAVAVPRVIALSLLNRIGVDQFNFLPIIAFATSPKIKSLTSWYSFSLAVNFAAPLRGYQSALSRSRKPVALLVGGSDELFYPEKFAPTLQPNRPDLNVAIVPGLGNIGMTVSPTGIAAIVKTWRDMLAPVKTSQNTRAVPNR